MGQIKLAAKDCWATKGCCQVKHPKTARLFTIHRYPIRYLVIPKCGCTYVKNLLWTLEKGERFANPIRIHEADERFQRASELGLIESDVAVEEYAFTIVRKPVDRFLSLYFDKVIGEGHRFFVPLRKILAERHGLNVHAVDIAAHQENCRVLARWLRQNLSQSIDIEKEAHWTPQAYRKNLMKEMNLKVLTLEALTEQLQVLLGDLVPELGPVMAAQERNASTRAHKKQDILTGELKAEIDDIYSTDRQLYNRARRQWMDRSPSRASEVPRFSDLQIT